MVSTYSVYLQPLSTFYFSGWYFKAQLATIGVNIPPSFVKTFKILVYLVPGLTYGVLVLTGVLFLWNF